MQSFPDHRLKSEWLDYIHPHSEMADASSSAMIQITDGQLEMQCERWKWAQ